MTRKTIFLISLTLIILMTSLSWATETGSPQDAVKMLLGNIQKIQNGDNLTKAQAKSNDEISSKAIKLLDLQVVSQKSLGKYWKKRSPEERTAFLTLLEGLFVHIAFTNTSKFFKDLEMSYGETKLTKTKAVVPLKVIHDEEGEVFIDFVLTKKDKHWLVVDVVLDDVSMRNNLKSQFYKILKKEEYQELVQRMQKKLKEAKG
ncbi:MAG: ABC transporter substrate-binding protein [Nitrospinales bacterium]